MNIKKEKKKKIVEIRQKFKKIVQFYIMPHNTQH